MTDSRHSEIPGDEGPDMTAAELALGVLDGKKLAQIADDEGISTSAVSQRHRSGVSVLVESIAEVPR